MMHAAYCQASASFNKQRYTTLQESSYFSLHLVTGEK